MRNMPTDRNGKSFCNFVPCVDCVIEVYSSKDEIQDTNIQLHLNFEDGSNSKLVTVPVSDLEQIKWEQIDSRCHMNFDVPLAKIKRFLIGTVRDLMCNAHIKTVYVLDHPGVAKIKGESVFCIGKDVIKPPYGVTSALDIMPPTIAQHMDVDEQYTEVQAVAEMFDLISISPKPSEIIITYKLLFLMRRAYIDAGARPNFCIYLYGRTGTQKTTMSSFLTQMYNRNEGIVSPPRLNASKAAVVEMLLKCFDDAFVLDDLAPSDNMRTQKQQEEMMIEVVRYVADGILPAKMMGKDLFEKSPECGVIFTGEYIIGSGSDAARLLPVEMMQPDGEKLKYFQDHPLIVSTFYRFFIVWFVDHYIEIVSLLKEWLNQYRKEKIAIHDRLQEAHFFLNTAYSLLLQYCCEKNFLSERNAVRLHRNFLILLDGLVRKQNKRVEQSPKVQAESVSYLNRIRMMYKNGTLDIARNKEQFDVEWHDGVIHRNSLYLRGDKLAAYFSEVSIGDVIKSLNYQGVLETGKINLTKQISALSGMRFYVIPLHHLD